MRTIIKQLILLLFVSSLLLNGCNSSEKLLEKGSYDRAIEKSVDNLRKKPSDRKELRVLKEAYSKANNFDHDRIRFLEREGRPENWIEIYELYSVLDFRQNRIKTLPSSVLGEFKLVDYDDKVIESKNKAAELLYESGIARLENGGRENARMAYADFEQITRIYNSYRDVDVKIEEARYLGTNQVLFVIENNSDKILPEDFDYELKKISLNAINRDWLNFDTREDSSKAYDFLVVLDIDQIEISPERIDSRTYTESAEIEDGTRYVFDENGNVKKDSLGNDIRVPAIKEVKAEVVESVQYKSARVAGAVDYVDLRTGQLAKTEEIIVDAIFEYHSAVASGDKEALSKETLKKLNRKPAPFPTNEELMMDAAHLLKEKTKAIVNRNRNLLRSP